MPPSKHKSGLGFAAPKKKPVVEPKIRALRNDYAEVKLRKRELIIRFESLAKDCKNTTGNDPFRGCIHRDNPLCTAGSCLMRYCPLVRKK